MFFKKKSRYGRYSSYSTYSSYSRRKRVRWDRILPVAGGVLLVVIALVFFNLNRIKLMFKGYSFSTTNQILKLEKEDVKTILSYDELEHAFKELHTEFEKLASKYSSLKKKQASMLK